MERKKHYITIIPFTNEKDSIEELDVNKIIQTRFHVNRVHATGADPNLYLVQDCQVGRNAKLFKDRFLRQ